MAFRGIAGTLLESSSGRFLMMIWDPRASRSEGDLAVDRLRHGAPVGQGCQSFFARLDMEHRPATRHTRSLTLTRGGRRVRISERELLDALIDGLALPHISAGARPRLILESSSRSIRDPSRTREYGRHRSFRTETHHSTPPHRLRARIAWVQRARILSQRGRSPLARQFLSLVAERSHKAYSVAEAARSMGISRSSLERLCAESFGRPPALLIGLGRIVSVADALPEKRHTLKFISIHHAFPSASIMSRLFTRFVGISPGAFRARAWLGVLKEIDRRLTETDH